MTSILFCKYIKEVLNLLDKNNIDKVFIPKRMICILKPLDRAINYPFKKYLKHKYTDFILSNNNNVK